MTTEANPAVLLEQLKLLVADPLGYFQDDSLKSDIQRLSRDASRATEEPFETMQRLVYGVNVSTPYV
jgi:hypothetical protein